MLSNEIISNESPKPIRIKFKKVGNLKYISHLDMQRTFEKVLIRAGIPAWYTQGFNPHAKMVFSLPLSLGTESACEFLDIRIVERMTLNEIKARLDRALTDELSVIKVYEPKTKLSDIAFAEYEININTKGADDALCEKINKLFSTSPLMLTKKSKSGDREIDIIPMIRSFEAELIDGIIRINCLLACEAGSSLNPEMLITAMKERLSILSTDIMEEDYSIFRKNVYLSDGVTVFE